MDFVVPADHRVKLKDNKKKDKYLDHARELKNLRNIKVMILLIVIGTLGPVTERLIKGQDDLEIKRTRRIVDIAALADRRVKLKESEKELST